MVLARKEFDATDEAGNLLTDVEVRVELEGGGLVSIYSDRAGATPLSNPQTFADGHVAFHAAGGAHKITLTQGAYSRVLRYQAIGTKQEQDQGDDFAGFSMQWEAETSAPPTAGCIRANNATLSAATEFYISETNVGGSSIAARLAELAAGDRIIITAAGGVQVSVNVSTAVDSGAYYTFGVTGHSGETTLEAALVGLQLDRNGVDGKFSGTEVIKTAAYNALAADVGKTIILNKATADTLSFDPAATLGSTWMVMVKNIGAGTWSLDPNGAETIDGTASISLSTGESCVVSCNGTALRTLFRGSASAIVNHKLFGGL